MPVSLYMQTCLHDPKEGYYATRPGLGEDFTTAPEISQIFGELIGLWVVHEWIGLGRPAPFSLIEPGPGRATLMVDALAPWLRTRRTRLSGSHGALSDRSQPCAPKDPDRAPGRTQRRNI